MWDNYKYLFLLLILFGIIRCNTTEPPNDKQSINLKLEDVSCTETWIEITTTNLPLPVNITLLRDNVAQNNILCYGDTLLYIDSLLPNTSYQYQASSIPQSGGQYQVSSNELSVTTLDTTSHNFTWQTWTFGEHSSSVLYDVAIINENSIYAVGEIYMNDSLGQQDPTRYNAVIWNGESWTVMRIPYYFQGQPFYNPIQSVFVFGQNDIWFCGNGVIHWDGNSFVPIPISNDVWGPFQMNKIWGRANYDLYIVGNGGNIAQYNGTRWRKIESGTEVDLQDIWGITSNNITPFILCAVSYVAQLGEHKILRINNSEVDSINWETGRRVHSIWFDSDKKLYACGGGIFLGTAPGYNWIEQTQVPLFFTERVRGKGKNDLFVVGHFGLLAHFNGTSWKTYPEAATAEIYKSLDYKNNLMVTVGLTQTQAVVQIFTNN